MSDLNKFVDLPQEILVQVLKKIRCIDTYVVLYESEKFKKAVEDSLIFIDLKDETINPTVGEMKKKMPGVKAYQYKLSEQDKLLQEWAGVHASVQDKFFIVSDLRRYALTVESLMGWVNICSRLKLHHFLVTNAYSLRGYLKFDGMSSEMDDPISKFWHGTRLCDASELSLTQESPLAQEGYSAAFLNTLTASGTLSSLNISGDYASKSLKLHLPLHQLRTLSLTLGDSDSGCFFYSLRNCISLKTLHLKVGTLYHSRPHYYPLESYDMPELKSLKLEALNDHVKFEIRNCQFPELKEFVKNKKSTIRLIENCHFGNLESFKLHSNSYLSIDGLKLREARKISITGGFYGAKKKNSKPAKLANIQVSKLEDLRITSGRHLSAFKKIESSGKSRYVPQNITISANAFRRDILYHYNALKWYKLDISAINVSFEFPPGKDSEEYAMTQWDRLISSHPYLRVGELQLNRKVSFELEE